MSPLTKTIPKALLNIGGKTLIDWTIERLKQAGIKRIVVAVGWKGSLVEDYLATASDSDTYIVDVKDYDIGPLQTLKTALETFDDDFLLTPVDLLIPSSVISGILTQYSATDEPRNMTLAVDFDIGSGTLVSISEDSLITGFGNEISNTSIKGRSAMLFIGNSRLAKNCRDALNAGESKFVSLLSQLVHSGHVLRSYPVEYHGLDIDTLPDLLSANHHILNKGEFYQSGQVFVPAGDSIEIGNTLELKSSIILQKETELIGPVLISSGCTIGEGCRIGPNSTIGANCRLLTGCELSNTIVFGESIISAHSRLQNMIVYKSEQIKVEQ